IISRHSHCNRPCPLYPRKQTFAVHQRMSALGQKRTSRQEPLLPYSKAEIAQVEAFGHLRLPGGSGTKRTVLAKSDTDDTTQRWGDIRPIPSACRTGLQNAGTTLDRRREPQRSPHMNKQMTLAEIDVPACGRSAMKFTGLDKFDTLLGPNEESMPHMSKGHWDLETSVLE